MYSADEIPACVGSQERVALPGSDEPTKHEKMKEPHSDYVKLAEMVLNQSELLVSLTKLFSTRLDNLESVAALRRKIADSADAPEMSLVRDQLDALEREAYARVAPLSARFADALA